MNKLMATHDSATGEKPSGFLSALLIPFARTQGKTIKEQFNAGCRYFDIRVRNSWSRGWVCAHGLFTTRRSACSIIDELEELAYDANEFVYINLTYEGWGNDEYSSFVNSINDAYSNVRICNVNIKYSEGLRLKWKHLRTVYRPPFPSVDKFVKLDFRDWRTLIPIPWLYKKLYYNVPEFNDKEFTFVDFL